MIIMCLAIPARVVEIHGDTAKVDFGKGVFREISIALVETKIEEYVLVHAGYAIQTIDRKEAEETIKLWNDILKMEEPNS